MAGPLSWRGGGRAARFAGGRDQVELAERHRQRQRRDDGVAGGAGEAPAPLGCGAHRPAIMVVMAALRRRCRWSPVSAARRSLARATHVASVTASAIPWQPPWPRSGVIGWMAPP